VVVYNLHSWDRTDMSTVNWAGLTLPDPMTAIHNDEISPIQGTVTTLVEDVTIGPLGERQLIHVHIKPGEIKTLRLARRWADARRRPHGDLTKATREITVFMHALLLRGFAGLPTYLLASFMNGQNTARANRREKHFRNDQVAPVSQSKPIAASWTAAPMSSSFEVAVIPPQWELFSCNCEASGI